MATAKQTVSNALFGSKSPVISTSNTPASGYNSSGSFNTPTSPLFGGSTPSSNTGSYGSMLAGIQAKAPVVATPSNKISPAQSKTSSPSFSLSTLAQQKALNANGAGLVEDGILGPKTQAAIDAAAKKTTSPAPVPTTNQPTATVPTTAPAVTPPQTGPYTPPDQGTNGINQGGVIGNLINQSQNSSQDYKDAQKQYQDSVKNLADYKQKLAETNKNISAEGISLNSARGQEANIGQAAASNIDALQQAVTQAQQGLGYANTQQGLQVQAGNAAANANAPTGNIINVSPITGLPVAGGSLGQLANIAGQVQGIQSGAAAQAAAGGNIAAQNQTALGTASTGASAHSIADFTNQINTTQKSIDTLNSIGSKIAPNMGTTGFNPTSSPVGNETFANYFKEKNPAATAGIREGLTEIKNNISNVIASATGLTPTGVTSALDSIDINTLNPQQLNDFLLYIDNYAKMNIAAAQSNVQRLQSGGSINTSTGPLPAPDANSTGQAALGTGATVAKGLIGNLLSHIGGVLTGGLAEKVLGL